MWCQSCTYILTLKQKRRQDWLNECKTVQFSWPVGHATSEVGGGGGCPKLYSDRKASEAHLIDKVMTLEPHDISRCDELN